MIQFIIGIIGGIIGATFLACFFVLCWNVSMIRKGIRLMLDKKLFNQDLSSWNIEKKDQVRGEEFGKKK